MKDLPNKILLRVDEVATFFDVSNRTIYNWIESGILKACNPRGGSLRIFRKSVIDAIENGMK